MLLSAALSVGIGSGAARCWRRWQPSVVVEERVGDAGFALDGLECHRLATFDQSTDRGIGCSGLFFGFAAGCGLQNVDALLAGVVHETRFR